MSEEQAVPRGLILGYMTQKRGEKVRGVVGWMLKVLGVVMALVGAGIWGMIGYETWKGSAYFMVAWREWMRDIAVPFFIGFILIAEGIGLALCGWKLRTSGGFWAVLGLILMVPGELIILGATLACYLAGALVFMESGRSSREDGWWLLWLVLGACLTVVMAAGCDVFEYLMWILRTPHVEMPKRKFLGGRE